MLHKAQGMAPAAPPEARFPAMLCQNWVPLSTPPERSAYIYLWRQGWKPVGGSIWWQRPGFHATESGLPVPWGYEHVVYNALALLIWCDLPADMLHLQQQLDPPDGCYCRTTDGHSHSTCQEVLGKVHSGVCHFERKRRGKWLKDRTVCVLKGFHS